MPKNTISKYALIEAREFYKNYVTKLSDPNLKGKELENYESTTIDLITNFDADNNDKQYIPNAIAFYVALKNTRLNSAEKPVSDYENELFNSWKDTLNMDFSEFQFEQFENIMTMSEYDFNDIISLNTDKVEKDENLAFEERHDAFVADENGIIITEEKKLDDDDEIFINEAPKKSEKEIKKPEEEIIEPKKESKNKGVRIKEDEEEILGVKVGSIDYAKSHEIEDALKGLRNARKEYYKNGFFTRFVANLFGSPKEVADQATYINTFKNELKNAGFTSKDLDSTMPSYKIEDFERNLLNRQVNSKDIDYDALYFANNLKESYKDLVRTDLEVTSGALIHGADLRMGDGKSRYLSEETINQIEDDELRELAKDNDRYQTPEFLKDLENSTSEKSAEKVQQVKGPNNLQLGKSDITKDQMGK